MNLTPIKTPGFEVQFNAQKLGDGMNYYFMVMKVTPEGKKFWIESKVNKDEFCHSISKTRKYARTLLN